MYFANLNLFFSRKNPFELIVAMSGKDGVPATGEVVIDDGESLGRNKIFNLRSFNN